MTTRQDLPAAASTGDAGLVPLADRLFWMQAVRVALAGAVLAGTPLLGSQLSPGLCAATAAYLALSLLPARASRRRRADGRSSTVTLLGIGLLLDAVYLALTTYGTAGVGSPLQYLVVVHLVAATLLGSFRTGLKLALWHSMLAATAWQLERDGAPHVGTAPAPLRDLAALLLVAWAVTAATATLAAVNERELRRRTYDLDALAALSLRLERSVSAPAAAQALVDGVVETFGFPRAVLLAAPSGSLNPVATHGTDEATDAAGSPDEDRLVARTMRERRTLRVAQLDAAEEPWLAEVLDGARNVLAFPLVAEDAPLGVLVVEQAGLRAPGGRPRPGGRVERRVVDTVERFASMAALALSGAWLLERVTALATTDALTGVANRRSFDEALERELSRASRSGAPFALALLDIDFFKRLNDTYGHQTGDVALQRVAAAVAGAVRGSDVVARYGGEEFAVVMPATGLEDAAMVAERVRAAVQAIEAEPHVTVSVGVAAYPEAARTAPVLLAAADAALYASKEGGRNRVSVAGVSDADQSVGATTGPAEQRGEQAVPVPVGA
ncbi:GGDEF domain-containing protein [Motilibacter deserti]|uniref:Sensor domain-containing diguanylate cyclase n=1 Tax=Motilibacter deserti TaxID=2714956 RepID=A0ABX0GQE9_9ACTN|nr:GGDEF domain-containing protein [Motilibacter deserti]NHC12351.1 sensor domain-containing diguanylate cyclase [Motilibacter deserti]